MSDLNETARNLVNREIHYCVSGLISAMFQDAGRADSDSNLFGRGGAVDPDDIARLYEMEPDAQDYSEAIEIGTRLTVTDGPDGWTWTASDPDDGEVMDEAAEPFETELEAYQDAFDQLGWDRPSGSEIYEHWIISDWLADKLAERGHTVARDIAGLTIWGRPTSGQAIYADSVIQDIAREVESY